MNHRRSSLAVVVVVFFFFVRLTASAPSRDEGILLRTKREAQLVDDNGMLDDWIPGTSHCNWSGIACDPSTHAVTSIDLSGFLITGVFPSGFCQLPKLRSLLLGSNFLNGTLSTDDVRPCCRLRHLNLSINSFVGRLPDFPVEFGDLLVLDVSQNNFSGNIPPSFGRFPSLRVLNLFANILSGKIPPFLGNLTELVEFNLAYNPFERGPLPAEIGNLTKLQNLWLPFSNLEGGIPSTIGNLAALKNLDLSDNGLTGVIPESIGRLASVTQIELYRNRLSGYLPESMGNLSSLLRFDASENALIGKIPEKLAALSLLSLGLNDNFLEGQIPPSISRNPNLTELKLFNNSFSGELPRDLGRNSNLALFDVSTNGFVGELPRDLCYGGTLRSLIIFSNRFSGGLPDEYGGCKSLSYIRIQNNSLSGDVPVTIWSLPNLYYLEIRYNRFQGSISSSIAGARNLTKLLVSYNRFSGELPVDICQLSDITVISLQNNNFSGELPQCIAGFTRLETLQLQHNKFSGPIPVGRWPDLTEMNLSRNRFSGAIPAKLGKLPVLTYLDLSENQLSGAIPTELTKLKLNRFNISNNNISGEIPSVFDTAFYLPSIAGNPNLCTNTNLYSFAPCSTRKHATMDKSSRSTVLFTAAFLSAAGLIFLSVFCCWFRNRSRLAKNAVDGRRRRRRRRKMRTVGPKSPWKLTSFQRIGFNESDVLDGLSEGNLIGSGSSGRVYRVTLKSGQTVAVKKLFAGAHLPEAELDFRSEMETLGRVRHGNIVKLLFCCTSEDARVLVYEFMENGSLGDVLHGEKGGAPLDWERRVKIAVGAAQGLAYLHHDCAPPIVHRDVKPNNILLDGEFCARVADFGLARLLQPVHAGHGNDRSMTHVAGSYGYIAPEYAYTLKVNEKSDVYSFGVVLLELVTGRRAVEPEFGEGRDIVKWVTEKKVAAEEENKGTTTSFHFHSMLDQRLRPWSTREYEDMVSVLNVGLLCTAGFPMNRPSMRSVVDLLKHRRPMAGSVTFKL